MAEWILARHAQLEDVGATPSGNSLVRWASIPSEKRLLTRAEWVEGADWETADDGFIPLPAGFWEALLKRPGGAYRDWRAGVFRAQMSRGFRASAGEIVAYGVEFSVVGLERRLGRPLSTFKQLGIGDPAPVAVSPVSEPEERPRGRTPRADWWPDFVAELVLYIYNENMPATDERIINEVFARLAERGKEEGSRSSVQPVVRAVRKLWDNQQ